MVGVGPSPAPHRFTPGTVRLYPEFCVLDTYRTSDLYYAAYLRVAEVPFLGTERTDGRVVFLFESSDALPDLKRGYFTNTARIPALSYVQMVREMKSLVHR